MKKHILTAAALAAFAYAGGAAAEPQLSSVFTDHMVLQRGKPITVWGTADPGERVSVTFAKRSKSIDAAQDGSWKVSFPAMKSGGPLELAVTGAGGAGDSASDILIGDVFLCSGQSNMEFPVYRALNPDQVIKNAADDRIRLLQIENASAASPQSDFAPPPQWTPATPQSVRDFSALCLFFAQDIIEDAGAPLGLINSTWGGSRIEAWTSTEMLSGYSHLEASLALLEAYRQDPKKARAQYAEQWFDWWKSQPDAPDLPFAPSKAANWKKAPDEKISWKKWDDPALADHNGMVWYRKNFTLTDAQAAQDAVLNLGGVDEIDMTWINGEFVGGMFGWGDARSYEVPAEALKAGENDLLVNVYSSWADAGMYGPAEEMTLAFPDGSSAPLDKGWRYDKVPASMGAAPPAPWHSITGLSGLHNAMIAPLGETALKGAIWYQGESNTREAENYESFLQTLIADWRDMFGPELPVIVIQLPVFGPMPSSPVESGWSIVREAERRVAMNDPKTGLVVALDAGNPRDIHPTDKQIVAQRTASLARSLFYGEKGDGGAPSPSRAYADNGSVVVDFDNLTGDAKVISATAPIAFELCAESGECRFVDAEVEGSSVLLSAPEDFAPARVRYCWGDSPICNWYDRHGTPVTPFELDIK